MKQIDYMYNRLLTIFSLQELTGEIRYRQMLGEMEDHVISDLYYTNFNLSLENR